MNMATDLVVVRIYNGKTYVRCENEIENQRESEVCVHKYLQTTFIFNWLNSQSP